MIVVDINKPCFVENTSYGCKFTPWGIWWPLPITSTLLSIILTQQNVPPVETSTKQLSTYIGYRIFNDSSLDIPNKFS